MTAKEWLSRGRRLDIEINALLKEQEQALQMATSTVTNIKGERVQTSKRNTAENRFIHYAEYSKTIDERIDELYRIKAEISQMISKVENNTLRQLLTLRYINFETWEKIAEELDYSREWITKALHPRALLAIEKIKSSF